MTKIAGVRHAVLCTLGRPGASDVRRISTPYPTGRGRGQGRRLREIAVGGLVEPPATHDGELMGVPPTGTQVHVELIDIMRFDDAGLVSEHWGVADMLSLMQQLGVVPTGQPA